MTLAGSIDNSSAVSRTWVESTLKRQREWKADILNIDLIPYFKTDHNSTREDHKELVKVLKDLKHELRDNTYNVQVSVNFYLICDFLMIYLKCVKCSF